VKDKDPVHGMQAYTYGGDTAPHIPNLGARWRSVVNITLRALYLAQELPFSME